MDPSVLLHFGFVNDYKETLFMTLMTLSKYDHGGQEPCLSLLSPEHTDTLTCDTGTPRIRTQGG